MSTASSSTADDARSRDTPARRISVAMDGISSHDSLTQPVLSHVRAQQLFDRTADDYQKRVDHTVSSFSSLVFQRRIEIVTRFLDRIPTPGRVLDFGMGPAVFAHASVDRGLHYVGVDISPVMVHRARALNLANAEYVVGDLQVLELYEQQFDGVLAVGLLDYLEDPWTGLSALSSCVKPGGALIVSFRNRRSLPRLLRDVAKSIARPLVRASSHRAFLSPVHERSFDVRSELQPALQQLGYDEVQTAYFNCSPFFFNFPIPRGLWQSWHHLDRRLAFERTRWSCSGGVVFARRQ